MKHIKVTHKRIMFIFLLVILCLIYASWRVVKKRNQWLYRNVLALENLRHHYSLKTLMCMFSQPITNHILMLRCFTINSILSFPSILLAIQVQRLYFKYSLEAIFLWLTIPNKVVPENIHNLPTYRRPFAGFKKNLNSTRPWTSSS